MNHPCTNFKSLLLQILNAFLLLYTFSSLDSATASTPQGNEIDLHALFGFRKGIVQDPFHIMSFWNHSIHHCNWIGITCNISNGRVIHISLENSRLGGTLTPSIGNLTFLTTLNLLNNSIHGELPQELGNLLYLQNLNLSLNNFGGSIPSNLSHCTELRVLAVGANKLEGTIPTWIGNLSSLSRISFGLNNFHGSIPHGMGSLSSLTSLVLYGNFLSGTVPSSIWNISSLYYFTLTQNNLHGNLPADVGFTLPNLEIFAGGVNNFTGTIPESLSNATRLEILDFAENGLTGTLPKNIGRLSLLKRLNFDENRLGTGKANDLNFLGSLVNCTVLRVLGLSANSFGGELPSLVANLSTQLNILTLGSNAIHGRIPVGIGNLVDLSILGLEMNSLSGSVPDTIGMLQMLNGLHLNDNNFSGVIPSSTGNLTRLIRLFMEKNNLEGSIPRSLGKCKRLLMLNFSHNKLNGTIPREVISLSSLSVYLDLSHSVLTGFVPIEVGKLVNLEELDLSENKLSGMIPSSLGSCNSLELLHLQGNLFEGNIPSTIKNLRGIQDIDLSRNNLTGKIPEFLGQLVLEHLNLSYNDFEGKIPTNGIFKYATSFSIYGNSKLCGGVPELNFPSCTIRKKTSLLRKILAPKVAIPIAIALIFILLLSCFLKFFPIVKRARKRTSRSTNINDLELEISYSEIAKCTGGFSQDNLIGSGSFGSVYKGTLSSDGSTVAVKVLNLQQRGASRSFIDECQVLRSIRHRNLLKIINAISSIDHQGNDFKALIFEFMSNGSLEDWLHPLNNQQYQTKTLTFIQRLNIAIDVACALEYLHHYCETPIVHCDIKPSNVLLDNEMVAHVGDFGLATFLLEDSSNFSKQSIVSASLRGSIGYIPPEYGMGGKPSTLGDIYSFGILLLEIFTGKRPTDETFAGGMGIRQFITMASRNHVMDITDPTLFSEEEFDQENETFEGEERAIRRNYEIEVQAKGLLEDCIVSLMEIGVSCTATSPNERMHINVVVNKLHDIKNSVIRKDKVSYV